MKDLYVSLDDLERFLGGRLVDWPFPATVDLSKALCYSYRIQFRLETLKCDDQILEDHNVRNLLAQQGTGCQRTPADL